MLSPFAWSPLLPRWLAGLILLILLGLLAAAVLLWTAPDPSALNDLGSWRWPHHARVG
jgi:hypothetical protein